MKSVAHIFEQFLAKVLSPENPAVSKLNLFSENDWQRIRKWTSNTPQLQDRCIHEAIHDQALSGPDREAVCAWDGSFTYGELDTLASKLACHLRMQGVGPEVRVALLFDKSVSNFDPSIFFNSISLSGLHVAVVRRCGRFAEGKMKSG